MYVPELAEEADALRVLARLRGQVQLRGHGADLFLFRRVLWVLFFITNAEVTGRNKQTHRVRPVNPPPPPPPP